MNTKICPRCRTSKELSEFNRNSRTSDGLQCYCRLCEHTISAAYRAANAAEIKRRHATYYVENKDKIIARTTKWSKENQERRRTISRRSYWKNPQKAHQRCAKWFADNPDYATTASLRWRAANPEKLVEYNRKYKSANKALVNAITSRRKARLLKATPPWANHKKIVAFYSEAQLLTELTGVLHHVDHIIPLKSKLVCGLHCEDNLQVLTESENSSKNNKFVIE